MRYAANLRSGFALGLVVLASLLPGTSGIAAADVSPIITTSPLSPTVIPGGLARFDAAASGTPTPTVQWQLSTNGGSSFSDISGATTTSYSVNIAQSDSGNQFRAVFTNTAGTATTAAATVTVGSAPAGAATAVSAGGLHACAVTSAGGVMCWGYGVDGELGTGSTGTSSTPLNVSGLTSGITAVAAGGYHTCALTTGGGVSCWGYNVNGQLGDGSTTNRSTPVNVSGLTSGVATLAAGDHHTCVVTAVGGVKCWGWNGYGQLGTGSISDSSTPVDVPGLTDVTAVTAGWGHTCAVTTGGVKCWGRNLEGQLGDGSTTNRTTPVDVSGLTSGVAAVTAGGYHTCARTTVGGVMCWGRSTEGQLGNNSTSTSSTPVAVSGLASGVAAVSAGGYHTCAVTTGGGAKCWGYDAYGQLGTGSTSNSLVPAAVSNLASGVAVVAAGWSSTCALTTGGGVKCWGFNLHGQIGTGSYADLSITEPVNIGGLTAGAPSISQHPASQTVLAGASVSFVSGAIGVPTPSVQWQLSTNGSIWSNVSAATATTYTFTAAIGDSGTQYRALFTNTVGVTATAPATLTVQSAYGPISATPQALVFGATKAGVGAVIQQMTPAQAVVINVSGAASAWTVSSAPAWLTITGGSGSSAGQFTVALNNTGDVIGGQTALSGSVVITAPTAPNTPLVIPVTVNIYQPNTTAGPFGAFDTPTDGTTGMQGSFAVTGWALDDVAINRVEIWRDLVQGEDSAHAYTTDPSHPGFNKVFIASPLFVRDARPDVEGIYAAYPLAYRAGWGYLLLSWGLEGQGNGVYRLYAFAFDLEGHNTALGTKTITVDNAHASKPFGSIDTPGYGETKSGTFVNFGWALTPAGPSSCRIDNGHVWVTVDSLPATLVTYGDARADIAASFPGFLNSTNASGYYYVNTTTLTNGRHQIGWLVYDNCGRGDGIGSRFFNVLNSSARPGEPAGGGGGAAGGANGRADGFLVPLGVARAGAASTEPVGVRQQGGQWQRVTPGADGTRVVEVAQDGRIEVQMPPSAGAAWAGAQEVGGNQRPLPEGSSLDATAGIFYWQPAPGFLGKYDLVFGPSSNAGAVGGEAVRVRVIVGPTMRAVIDTPRAESVVAQPFTLSGWALDLAAHDGTGIDTVHVWAYPATGAAPIFLGVAAYGDTRPDVGTMYGDTFTSSAYGLTVAMLAPGTYDVVVYPHRTATNTFDGAQVVRVIVR